MYPQQHCNYGVGCEESGICYAAAQGVPRQCGSRAAHTYIKDNTVAVDADYYYRPMAECPRGVKCILLNEGGVAHIAVWHGEAGPRGWAPLPKERKWPA